MTPSTQTVGGSKRSNTLLIVAAFACLYLCWGSAFIAIRYSVQMIQPAYVAGLRYVIAAVVLLGYRFARRRSLYMGTRDLLKVVLLGLLMFSCNALLLSYGVSKFSAGFAALVIATVPLFIAVLEAVLPRGTAPTPIGWAGIATGFWGIALLLRQCYPGGLFPAQPWSGIIALLIAAFAWALGSVLLNRMHFQAPMLVCIGWQMFIGGAINIAIGLATGGGNSFKAESGPWLAVIYLATFCTLAGYMSYVYLLRQVSIGSVATYAYVNPLVAVALGWILLGEPMAHNQWVAMLIVLVSVAVVVNSNAKQRSKRRQLSAL
jgi:drug/metabolite transporter (DMT)-like permease